MKGITKRGNVYWISYTFGGKQRKESTHSSNLADAKALLAKRNTELFSNRFFPDRLQTTWTVQRMVEEYLRSQESKAQYHNSYVRMMYICDALGANKPISAITHADVQALVGRIQNKKTRRNRKPTNATVNRYMEDLASAFRLATDSKESHQDPCARIRKLPEKARDRVCSPEEYRKLVANCKKPDMKLIMVVLWNTAMRLGEVCSLEWSSVNFKKRTIQIREENTKNKTARIIPMTDECLEALQSFPRRMDGKVIGKQSYKYSPRFTELCTRLGIKDLRLHDFRGTAVTRMLVAGIPTAIVAKISGHKTLSILQRHYNRVQEPDLTELIRKIG